MDWRFSASGYSIGAENTEAHLEMMVEAGFSGIEGTDLIADWPYDHARLVSDARGAGVPFTSYHLAFGRDEDIAAFYEGDRLKAVDLVKKSLAKAARLEAPVGILHPAHTRHDVTLDGADRYLDQLSKSMDQLIPYAEDLGIKLAVENMMNQNFACYFSLPEHITKFGARFPQTSVGFCLDTGHSLISTSEESQLEVMDAMGDRIIALHLQDTHGNRDIHIAPGRGNVDFAGTFARLAALSIDVVMCIECTPFAKGNPFTLEDWRGLVNGTRALAAN